MPNYSGVRLFITSIGQDRLGKLEDKGSSSVEFVILSEINRVGHVVTHYAVMDDLKKFHNIEYDITKKELKTLVARSYLEDIDGAWT